MKIERTFDDGRVRIRHDDGGMTELSPAEFEAAEPRLLSLRADFEAGKLKPIELGKALDGCLGRHRWFDDCDKAIAAAGPTPEGRDRQLWAVEVIEKWQVDNPHLVKLYGVGMPSIFFLLIAGPEHLGSGPKDPTAPKPPGRKPKAKR